MSSPARIDVHQHVVPPFWAETLPAHGGDPSGWKTPDWSPDAAIAFMDSLGIETGILSLTAPGIVGSQGAERREMAQRVNDYTAGLGAAGTRRFGNFVTLPLPDIEGALRELERATDDLKADGVVLFSNYVGTYLGDASLNPLWEDLAGATWWCSFTRPSPTSRSSAACPDRRSITPSIRRGPR
jgi:aminocarboxymuconate-semialdehyde decarboxylase